MLIRGLYTLLLTIICPILMWGLYRKQQGKPCVGDRWKEHFGFTPPLKDTKSPIWIHAVSVGETLAVSPLIKNLKLQYPDQSIVITTTTPTGAEQAAKLQGIAEHRYMPFDFPFALKKFIKTINPSQLLIMETELWPNTLYTVAKAGIPISVINARLSERSCQRYAKVRPLFTALTKNIHQILCQYPSDAEHFIRLGISPDKVKVTGSIKFDIEISPTTIEQGNQLRQQLGCDRPIWIAASTHKGEDEQVLEAHRQLLKTYPNALLILVPRHPERFNAVFELCEKQHFETVRRTQNRASTDSTQVYLGDTMGEMLILLGAADICFMGGSLLGDKVGGHNVLEPAALGIPVITGPSYYNFKEITDQLLAVSGILIKSADKLAEALQLLINSTDLRNRLIKNAMGLTKKNQESLKNTLTFIMD